MGWLTSEHYSRLTKDQAERELAYLLKKCEDEASFKSECVHRFGGPMINVVWERTYRSASICFRQEGKENMNVHASVTISTPKSEARIKSIKQAPYQESVEVEGQQVSLPFTYGFCQVVLIKNEGGLWQRVGTKFWDSLAENRRQFFLRVAGENGISVVANNPDQFRKFER